MRRSKRIWRSVKMDKTVLDYLLESEGYVAFDKDKHNKFHFNICRLVKDEVRSHKWIEAEKGRNLSWEEAVSEWMNLHYIPFINAILPTGGARDFIKYHFERYEG